jgi:hypothetical protein
MVGTAQCVFAYPTRYARLFRRASCRGDNARCTSSDWRVGGGLIDLVDDDEQIVLVHQAPAPAVKMADTVDATFVLPVGFTNAVLNTSLFAADDRAVLQLNGTNVSETGILGPGSGSFYFLSDGSDNAAYNFRYDNSTSTFDPITVPFVVGTNTLHFIVNNTLNGIFGGPIPGNHAALLFEGTVSFDAVSAVPEPSTWAMMLLGFAGAA